MPDIFSQITAEITASSLQPEIFPKYSDVVSNPDIGNGYKFYPDMSRSIDDMISVFGMITSNESPLVTMISGSLLKRKANGTRLYFEDGLLTPPHTHNFAELGYVAEGQVNAVIENQECIFNQGDIFIIDKDVFHNEYLYRKNAVVIFISVANSFFDKTIHHDTENTETGEFIKKYITGSGYRFLRLIPKNETNRVPDLLEKILAEFWHPHPGTVQLIIGYTEWLLNLLPAEYEAAVQQNEREPSADFLFAEVRNYLEKNFINVTLSDLIKLFGHNMNFFNLLVKSKTGMTFSSFVQSIKLEKAEFLLRTTDYNIEDIARQIGYENLTYFYRIFRTKYGLTPHKLRIQKTPSGNSEIG